MMRAKAAAYARWGFVLAAACTLAVLLSGCVFSATITEVIYDQSVEHEIDYDAPKIFYNSPNAEMKSDQIPLLDALADGTNDFNDDLPEYPGDLTNADVRESLDAFEGTADGDSNNDDDHDELEDNEGADDADKADPGVQAGDANTSTAPVPKAGSTGRKAATTTPSTSGATGGKSSGNSPDESGTGQNDNTGGDEGESKGGGGPNEGSNDAGGQGQDPNDRSYEGRNPGSTFGSNGANDELPDGVRYVAAVGEAAVICAALGGADGAPNLIAVNSDLVTGQARTVLASRGIGKSDVCWSGDGSLGTVDMDALIAAVPDAVLVMDGDPCLDEDQQARMTDLGVHIVYVPDMNSSTSICACVTRIGSLLGKGGDATAVDLANEYVRFHNNVLNACMEGEANTYTVYASEWRAGTYLGGVLANVTGAAFAAGGNTMQPGSSYMQAAGVANVTAVKPIYRVVPNQFIIWPFAGGTRDSEWADLYDVNGGEETTGSGYNFALTRYSPGNNSFIYYDLGTAEYPAMTVRTAAIRDAILSDRAAGGVYASGHNETSVATDDYGVYLNPHGMFSDWMDGSMESVLEAAWARKAFLMGGDDGGYLDEQTRTFYRTFYGYELADCTPIYDAVYAD